MHDGMQFVKQCRYQDRQIARHFISIEKKIGSNQKFSQVNYYTISTIKCQD